MMPYPAICESCRESATCINVKEQKVYRVCCATPGDHKPCGDVKVCPTTGLFIKSIIKVD